MTEQIGHAVALMHRRNKRVWLAKRRHVLGATDAVAVLGFSKWATPLDVWLTKTGRYTDDTIGDKYAVKRGNALEPLLIAEWVAQNPGAVMLAHPPLLAHPQHLMIAASLDGAAQLDGEQVVLEAKTAAWRAREDWWDETRMIPDQYAAQVLLQLAVTGLDTAHVVADIAGDFRTLIVERDRAFEAWALPALADWWQAHVVADVPPDPDPVRDYPSLKRLWVPEPGLTIEATPKILRAVDIHRKATIKKKAMQGVLDSSRGRIRVAARQATVITHDGETIASVSKSGALTIKQ